MNDYFSHKQVIITGVAGFIGSHLADRLLDLGASVIGVDSLITGSETNLTEAKKNPNFTFIKADVINDPSSYLDSNFKPDLIFHFASPASPPLYQQFPRETYLVNSIGTDRLLQYLLKVNQEARFLFASTSEVYGDPLEHPQKESYFGNVNPNGVRSCYDEGKRLGETICGVHQREFGLDVRIIRIFNTYGPRIDLKDGRVIPDFINQALKNQPLTVHGDGSQTRSYCFVDDLVTGILTFISQENLAGETVNLGNPGEFTVKETAKIIQEMVNGSFSEEDLIFQPGRGDDPSRRCPDINKAKNLLSWEPRISFKQGLQKTIEYFRNTQ